MKIWIYNIICAILFGIACLSLPYGYYQFLRIFTLLSSIYFFFFSYLLFEKITNWTQIAIGIIAIIMNPIAPIYMKKDTWVIFDIIFCIAHIAIAVYIIIYNINENKKAVPEDCL